MQADPKSQQDHQSAISFATFLDTLEKQRGTECGMCVLSAASYLV